LINSLYHTVPETAKGYSSLIDKTPSTARLYLILRAADTTGQGYIRINKQELIQKTGLSPSTVTRHLSDSKFFPVVKRSRGGIIVVSYRALNKICAEYGIDNLGACTEYKIEWLANRSQAIAYSTEAEVQLGQMQAMHEQFSSGKGFAYGSNTVASSGTKKEHSKGYKQSTIGQPLRRRKTGFKFIPRFRYFRIRPDQAAPGVSQKAIAKRLGRSERTIQRRLSNRFRKRVEVDPLQRRRVIRELTPQIERQVKHALEAEYRSSYAQVIIDGRLIQVGTIKVSGERARPYQLLTNVYSCDHVLIPDKGVRARLNQYRKELLGAKAP
jgi:hypothetical protein